jgi:hypothetical protein
MSFSLTTDQFLDGSKDVTRRLGWWFLKPGDRFRAVRKAMGLKKGEKVEPLGVCEVVEAYPVRLCDITESDVKREGFKGVSEGDFVSMFCKHMKCLPATEVNRIEFKRIEPVTAGGEE